MSDPATPAVKPVATWRKVVAAILDFLTIFIIGGYIIARFTGGTTEGGFSLSGVPALILFALIAVYFFVGYKYAGGTIWQRILRVR
jgi:DMSO reductase anchor subunit